MSISSAPSVTNWAASEALAPDVVAPSGKPATTATFTPPFTPRPSDRLSIEIHPIDHAQDDRLDRNLWIVEDGPRRTAFLHHQHLVADPRTHHVQGNDFHRVVQLVLERQSMDQQEFL